MAGAPGALNGGLICPYSIPEETHHDTMPKQRRAYRACSACSWETHGKNHKAVTTRLRSHMKAAHRHEVLPATGRRPVVATTAPSAECDYCDYCDWIPAETRHDSVECPHLDAYRNWARFAHACCFECPGGELKEAQFPPPGPPPCMTPAEFSGLCDFARVAPRLYAEAQDASSDIAKRIRDAEADLRRRVDEIDEFDKVDESDNTFLRNLLASESHFIKSRVISEEFRALCPRHRKSLCGKPRP
jgi:hypothetical protein